MPADIHFVQIPDITADTDWKQALVGVDVIVHTAARVHVMNESAADPLTEFRRVNVMGTERLARRAVAAGVKRLIYVSSIKVNGEVTQAHHKLSEADAPSPTLCDEPFTKT